MVNYKVDTIKLKKSMLDNNIQSITELSEKSGISKAVLSRIFNNKQRPTTTTIERLISVLHISKMDAGDIFFKEELA